MRKGESEASQCATCACGVCHKTVGECTCESSKKLDTKANIQPHAAVWHPDKTFIDIIISFLMTVFLPFKNLANHPNSISDAGTKAELKRLGDRLTTMEKPQRKSYLRKWSEKIDGVLIECRMKVPRKQNILCLWGLVDRNDACLKEIEKDGKEESIAVLVHGPASLLNPTGKREGNRMTEMGCVAVSSIDWTKVPSNVPILLWFHFGGLVLGNAEDAAGPKMVNALLAKQREKGEGDAPLAVVSIEYRLAPEHPFPSALIDALSVVDFFLDMHPNRRLHLGGLSAGGYLSVATALACHRRHQGRVQSAFVGCPMISPSSDSISYQLNATSSGACPVEFVRWCWRAVLELEEPEDKVPDLDAPILPDGSLRPAWQASKWWKSESWRKIIEPTEGIPSGLDNSAAAKYVVAVNRADPLHDEGAELAQKLQAAGANTAFIEASGSHVIGFEFDKCASAAMIEAWRSAIWD